MTPNRRTPQPILLDIYHRLFAAFGPQHWWPGETPFEVMVGAILTQNTNWGNVERAIANLKAAGILDLHAMAACPPERLAQLIRPSGYYNIKAQRLQAFLQWLESRTGAQGLTALKTIPTPELREHLLNITGIGPETADSILLYALDRRSFVVDAYTRRYMLRHRLIAATDTYGDVKRLYEESLPRSRTLYNEYHALIVRLGKEICRPRPRCEQCPLRERLGPPVLE